jgi:hypothetical protein
MKKRSTTCYVRRDQSNQLRELSRRTKVPIAEWIRQGIDKVLAQNAHHLEVKDGDFDLGSSD